MVTVLVGSMTNSDSLNGGTTYTVYAMVGECCGYSCTDVDGMLVGKSINNITTNINNSTEIKMVVRPMVTIHARSLSAG